MTKIFLSYRRVDTGHTARLLYGHLDDHFGEDVLFLDAFDIDTVGPGFNFVESLTKTVRSCAAVLALIGPDWLGKNEEGGRLVETEDDFVRVALRVAYEANKAIIPILVDGTRMPSPADLPADISFLSEQPAILLTDETFDEDLKRLIDSIHALRAAAMATQPLTAKPGLHIAYGHRTNIGKVRKENQDTVFAKTYSLPLDEVGLFIVADGMGGHADGKQASQLAATTVAKYMEEHVIQPLKQSPNPDSLVMIERLIHDAVHMANQEVVTHQPDGGSTMTAALLFRNMVYMGHVGDSRAYLVHREGLEQVTRDHSLVQRLVELGQLTQEQAQYYPQRNVLFRAVGQADELEVDVVTYQLPDNAGLFLCSDGVWNLVRDKDIHGLVQQHGDNVQAAVDALVDLANERGGTDNISAVLVRVTDEDAADED